MNVWWFLLALFAFCVLFSKQTRYAYLVAKEICETMVPAIIRMVSKAYSYVGVRLLTCVSICMMFVWLGAWGHLYLRDSWTSDPLLATSVVGGICCGVSFFIIALRWIAEQG